MSEKNTFYITTPIYYPNAKPHLGHVYTTVLADVMVRYYRLRGFETYFLTGLDENSEKVGLAAKKDGKEVGLFTDEIAKSFKEMFSSLGISYNQFIRTSDKEHHWPGAIAVWKRLVKAGDIYKGEYEGLYCVGCEEFKTEKDLDEKGLCPDHNQKPEKIKEENYFFKLSKYTKKIKKKIEDGKLIVEPKSRRNEILSLLNEGLEDVSFSRPKKKVPWGIPVPGDDSHVMYVWGEALTNYISALGFGSSDDSNFKRFWPADYHVMGKEISRFHVAIWPAMLLSAGLELPRNIFIHGHILSGGKKMSKTLGNVLNPSKFIDTYGPEVMRYYLCREVNPIEDSDMTQSRFKDAYNAHLANGLGNTVSRVMKMVEQYDIDLGEVVFEDSCNILMDEGVEEYRKAFASFRIDKAADIVWGELAFIDSYLQDTQPFKTIKEDEDKAQQDIIFVVERIWEVSVLLEPFMPDTAEIIQNSIKKGKAPKNLFPRKK